MPVKMGENDWGMEGWEWKRKRKGLIGEGDSIYRRKGKEGKGKEEEIREGNARDGSCPNFESLLASIWLCKHPLSLLVLGSIACTARYVFYLLVYGCGCATGASAV
jgi:hypothetical protein